MPSKSSSLIKVLAMNTIDSGNAVDDAINYGRKGVGVNHNKPIAGMKSNNPTTFSGFPFYHNKNDATKSNDPITFSSFPFYHNKNDATKSNDPTTFSSFPFYQNKNDATKSNDPTTFSSFPFYQNKNDATKSNDPTTFSSFPFYHNKNDATKSNDPTTFSSFPFYHNKNDVNGKSAVSENDPAAFPTKLSYVEQLKDNPVAALFFHRKDLRPGKKSTLQLAERDRRFAAFIPREEADAIPFSASELPSVLFHYNIPPGSNKAMEMKNTLQICEAQPVEGEEKRCATSLEAMVDFAMTRLDTRDVVPMSMDGEGAYFVEFRTYTVMAVKKVAEAVGKGAVSCHPQPYPYSVFACHALTNTEVYSVDLITKDDSVATMIKLPAICHLNTSVWSPDYISFKALGVEPGKGVVCHFIPQGHVTWVAKL